MPGFGLPEGAIANRARQTGGCERVLNDGGHTCRVSGPQGACRAEDLRDVIIVHGLVLSCRSRGLFDPCGQGGLDLWACLQSSEHRQGADRLQREFWRDVGGDADQPDDLDVQHFAGVQRGLEFDHP